ncbi:MAG: chromosome segregation protein SMC [Xanthomonadales bacterium]|nr:chromosome segregation protein SMC [Xanthomonadales bacterium]
MAGFKSFVDPTTLLVPTNLTGIVGPNGCGKSNIIDAVRWVMGEGSAKVLRGESMADVIFNGSSTRKPVGTATVELIFDNADGRIGGEYAEYSEISVKRQVSRDGVSNYHLNGGRCRKKDITNVFLGTGLGPRSYSIIEQGMISQIIEAKPEEVRSHLEEAAGISKYKERRRDTENRIARTRDNLDRLTDLRDEIGKHIERLKRQSRAAARWKIYKQESRLLESSLLALGWRELNAQAESKAVELKTVETSMESRVADQRAAEAELESIREKQTHASEAHSKVQGGLYEIGGEIARLEQTIQHEKEMQTRRKQEYEETRSGLKDLEKHIVLDRSQVEELTSALAQLEPVLKATDKQQTEIHKDVETKDSNARAWQEKFDTHRQEAAEIGGHAELKRAGIEHLDQRMSQTGKRLDALKTQSGEVAGDDLATGLNSAQTQSDNAIKSLNQAQKQLDQLQQQITQGRELIQQSQAELGDKQRLQATQRGRLSSLQVLQESVLEESVNTREWLQRQGLEQAKTLLETIAVEDRWRPAVEQVLHPWLDALLESPQDHDLSSLLQGSLALLNPVSGKTVINKGSLAAVTQAPDAILQLLNQVYTATDLTAAVQKQSSLKPGESVITDNAEWLGEGWVRVQRSPEGSVLDREQELRDLGQELENLDANVLALQQQLSEKREQQKELESRHRQAQADTNDQYRQQTQAAGKVEGLQRQIGELADRQQRDRNELADLEQRLADDKKSVKSDRKALEEIINRMAQVQSIREQLDLERTEVISQRDTARESLNKARDARHAAALKVESRRASLDSLTQSLARMDSQLGQLQQRFVQLSEQVAKDEHPNDEHKLAMDGLLQQRVKIEQDMATARGTLQGLENEYKTQDGVRQKSVREAEEIRQQLENQRLHLQELQIKARSLVERLSEKDEDAKTLAAALDEEVDVEAMQAELDTLQHKIQRIEPVNLAAIEEYEEESERKEYLDAQHEDLTAALTTLESAIAKIDRKTRSKFKETFEQVNKGIQELFPRLFGGGHAYLELTGDDLLTAGVSIMARPPGKRISSIYLLSGGEKALTAVALVFAIFRLNPAPFCLLDEVDAPLDDANVARFSTLVREMSEKVQFLFVSHNKVTMEMAYQLCGVTMREAGVSRLVSVDIEEATRYAQDSA